MEEYFEKKILPAITFHDADKAVKVAEAVTEGGLDIMEVPFRTPVAQEAISNIISTFPSIYIGAGTIITTKQVEEAKKAGAKFGLAPGFNPKVVEAAIANELPFIPGVMSPSEVELALEMGCNVQKLFPATQVGGLAMLKALSGPYVHTGLKLIPMGGVSLQNMNDFLNVPIVLAVGGSWLATPQLIDSSNYSQIKMNVIEALKSI
ncbi:bifunctional 4-hydroxy-2-oxoglutarate aldolase/2-dehydro-3-deoxy-phosphogluconate aldolase [Flavivirga eckloniae]|uniref:2-dehydro-3-deoxyphosphogluconate aldolase n=1 Tax=Flavivirga eckloniae TaxID=1803846 RepID=A0A2K9PN79_9FLAO|nr:bifunctional 4-hydroxy-2-oxoglutarate aldolase/2-dehydro-3-deoxy-phosphogluconate aldolase [Flavivirga eckloniae]AUP78520.1 2-dehydro-3-deoxyphosphogluconate aldolase [Flavivirga eckloniae]